MFGNIFRLSPLSVYWVPHLATIFHASWVVELSPSGPSLQITVNAVSYWKFLTRVCTVVRNCSVQISGLVPVLNDGVEYPGRYSSPPQMSSSHR